MIFDTWLMIRPELMNYLPTDDPSTVVPDLTDSSKLITEVDLYRVVTDPDNAVTLRGSLNSTTKVLARLLFRAQP